MFILGRHRLVPFIATVVVVCLGIALGNWQTRRGDQKDAQDRQLAYYRSQPPLSLSAADMDRTDLVSRRVLLHGQFDTSWPLYLDNRAVDGAPGFYVVMPFILQPSGQRVLVLRGWLPRANTQRTLIKPYRTPAGVVDLTGTVEADAGHALQLGEAEPLRPGAIIQNLTADQFSSATQLPVAAYFVQQNESAAPLVSDDGLVRHWPAPASGIATHRGYAFQWYALSCMAIIFFFVTGLRRKSRQTAVTKTSAS